MTSQLTTFKYILYTYNTIITVQFVNIAKYRTLRCSENCQAIYTAIHNGVTYILCTIECHGSGVGCSVIPALTRISCPCMLAPFFRRMIKDLSVDGQIRLVCLHNERMVNGLRKIAWTFVVCLKWQHINIYI
jgi:hypothetical protein